MTLNDNILHHRFSQPPEEFSVNDNGIVWEQEDRPIDLNKFDPLVGPCPAVMNQHLKWNFMLNRWQRIMLDGAPNRLVPYLDTKLGQAQWTEDPWADQVPMWKRKYGDMFQSYTKVGEILIQD